MRKQMFAAACLALLLSACTEENFGTPGPNPSDNIEVASVTFTASDFVFEDDVVTRTSVGGSTPNSFHWEDGDVIGIFPATGDQIRFWAVEGTGTANATADGGSWALKQNSKYYAYYPFSSNNFDETDQGANKTASAIQFTYAGQKAVLEDAEGRVDIGDFDYMYSSATTPAEKTVTFKFNHLGSLAKFNIKSEGGDATFTKLSITAGEAIFPLTGTFDLFAENVVLEAPEKSSSISIDLGGLTIAEDATTPVYFMLPPVDLSGQSSLKATLLDSNGKSYESDIEKKTLQASTAYQWSIAAVQPPDPDLSKNGTANCYIVPAAGNYYFTPTKGNSSESVGNISSMQVLWESFGTLVEPEVGALVSNVSHEGGVIKFTASAAKGNAVIAAKDASGAILWSWHIWMTDKPKDQLYRDGSYMLDRNLGATSATISSADDVSCYGLFYQWGRKDPFLGSGSSTESTKAASTISWPVPQTSNSTYGTISYVTEHPTTFIKGSNYWHDGKDIELWGDSKTIYDPCPSGYRVPAGGQDGVWAKSFGQNAVRVKTGTSEAFGINVFNLTKDNNSTYYLSTDKDCYYPLAGFIQSSSSAGGDLGSLSLRGYTWTTTAHTNKDQAQTFMVRNDGSYSGYVYLPGNTSGGFLARAVGASVRCLKEKQ